jgi:hypothetical protein
MNHKDEFDSILDHALAEYRDAEPLAGLEGRVLRRLQAQRLPPRNLLWRSSAALVCAAIVALAIWIGVRGRSREIAPSQPNVAEKKVAPAGTVAGTLGRKESPPIANRHAPSRRGQASATATFAGVRTGTSQLSQVLANRQADHAAFRNEQFPSATPLSPEEHVLIAAARTHPEILLDCPETGKELAIVPIHIQLLPDATGDISGDNQ